MLTPTIKAAGHSEDTEAFGTYFALVSVVAMEMPIPSLSVSREQDTALPPRPPGTGGILAAGAEQDPTLRKTEPTSDFASVLSSLFPASSSEDVRKNGDQQELPERSQSDPHNTSLPRSKEDALASLPTLAPTPDASPLLLSAFVHTDDNGGQPDSSGVSISSAGQTAIDHPDSSAPSQYVGEGPRRDSEQEYSLAAVVTLGAPLETSGHRTRPNEREAGARPAPFEEHRESETSISVGQEEDLLATLNAFPLSQVPPVTALREQAVREKRPEVVDVSSPSVGALLLAPPLDGGFAAPGGANAEEASRVGNGAPGAHVPSVEGVSPGAQLLGPTSPEPMSAPPAHKQDYGGSFAAHAALKVVAPYGVTHATEPSLTPVRQRELQDEAAPTGTPLATIPSPPTNEETQQNSIRLFSSFPSAQPPNVAVFQPEYPSTEEDLAAFGQFRGITTSVEPNGQGQPARAFVNQTDNKPFVTYADAYGAARAPNSVGEESLRSLTVNSHVADAEEFPVRRMRVQDRSISQSTGLDDARTHGDGLGVTASPPTLAQLRGIAGPVVIERVAREIAAHIDQGQKKAVIELEPQELGRVQIDLVLEGEKVQVRIVTEAAEVSSLIQTHLLELKQALQHHNLELGTVSVNVNSGGREQSELPYGSQPQLGRHNDNSAGVLESQTDESDPDIRRRNGPAPPPNGVSVWA